MMGCPWVYLVKRPDGHDGVPLGIRRYTTISSPFSIASGKGLDIFPNCCTDFRWIQAIPALRSFLFFSHHTLYLDLSLAHPYDIFPLEQYRLGHPLAVEVGSVPGTHVLQVELTLLLDDCAVQL